MPPSVRNGAKRLFELLLLLLLLPLWLPLAAACALLTRLFVGAPVLFRQRRAGLHGRLFDMYKFRTMTDARDAQGKLLPDAERLTGFGNFLRSTSLDELPSLVNVLAGDLALVGPRPLLPEYLPLYSPEQARRHQVRPGITGWAQVNGRNSLGWDERLGLDVWYVDNRSLSLDLRILFLTLLKVVRREGISPEGNPTMPPFSGPGS
jgi:lipopolysaccharide/colanic/teichoic acid biosynthesis glycosyltransferase